MKTSPLDQVHNLSARDYFTYGAKLMELLRPHLTDWSQIARRRRLGLKYGEQFEWNKLEPSIQEALNEAPATALQNMRAKLPTLARVVNGWQMNTDTMGVYGDYYLKRAIITMVGLGANMALDAIYPLALVDADGKPFDGTYEYEIHFEKGLIPPVSAFWSITMYDNEGFQCPNEINRFAIGDRDALKYNVDGSLDLHIQHKKPKEDNLSNWLPAPKGGWNLTMRLYGPKAEALDGRWNPPAVKRL